MESVKKIPIRWERYKNLFKIHIGKFWVHFKLTDTKKVYFMYETGVDHSEEGQITFAPWFFTLYINFPIPNSWCDWKTVKLHSPMPDGRTEFKSVVHREFGFYIYEVWTLVMHWNNKAWETDSRDPWYYHVRLNLPDMLFGRMERLENKCSESSQPVYFQLGKKVFKLDSIYVERNRAFRTRIPFALWHKTYYTANIECKQPPMRSGKGENSWDCGDDGTYGLSCLYEGPEISWDNRMKVFRWCCDKYVAGVLRDADRYGGSRSERGIKRDDNYRYLGYPKMEEKREGNRMWYEPIPNSYAHGNVLEEVK